MMPHLCGGLIQQYRLAYNHQGLARSPSWIWPSSSLKSLRRRFSFFARFCFFSFFLCAFSFLRAWMTLEGSEHTALRLGFSIGAQATVSPPGPILIAAM